MAPSARLSFGKVNPDQRSRQKRKTAWQAIFVTRRIRKTWPIRQSIVAKKSQKTVKTHVKLQLCYRCYTNRRKTAP